MIRQKGEERAVLDRPIVSNMLVRKMNFEDIDIVKNIYAESFEKNVSLEINYTNENIYVVCDGDIIMGMCMVNYIDDIFVNKRTAFVNAVCVDKAYRGRGVATFMLREIEAIAMEDGASLVMLTSSSKREVANHLYKKLGFDIYDTNVFKKRI